MDLGHLKHVSLSANHSTEIVIRFFSCDHHDLDSSKGRTISTAGKTEYAGWEWRLQVNISVFLEFVLETLY